VHLPEAVQEYHRRGRGPSKPDLATLRWSQGLREQLKALRKHTERGVDETAARVGRLLAEFVQCDGWAIPSREIAAKGDQEPISLTVRSNASERYHLPWELLSLAQVVHAGSLSRLLRRYEWPDTVTKPRVEGCHRRSPVA